MAPPRVALFFVLLSVVLVIASLAASPSEWREAVRWADARLAQLETRGASCPVLVGPPLGGSARARYESTLRLVGRCDAGLEDRLRELAAGATPAAGERPLDLVARLPAAARDELRHAVRAQGGLFSRETFGTRGDDFAWYELLPLADAWLVEARFAADEEARLAGWLDALACGIDLAGHEAVAVGAMGVLVVARVVEAASDGWLAGLSSAALAALDAALMRAEAGFAAEVDWSVVAVAWVSMVEAGVEIEPLDLGMRSRLQAWRHAFSLDVAAKARAQGLVDAVREFDAGTQPGDPWVRRRPALQELQERDARQTADVAFRDLGPVVDGEQQRRRVKAQLGLLRLAVAFRRGLDLPRIPDPLGDGPLVVEVEGDLLRCRSREPGVERAASR